MALAFPNSARSYDEANARVRFLGHDGMFEVRFYVLAEVLAGDRSPRTLCESDYLACFDALRPRILEVAKSAYKSSPDKIVTLSLDHFT